VPRARPASSLICAQLHHLEAHRVCIIAFSGCSRPVHCQLFLSGPASHLWSSLTQRLPCAPAVHGSGADTLGQSAPGRVQPQQEGVHSLLHPGLAAYLSSSSPVAFSSDNPNNSGCRPTRAVLSVRPRYFLRFWYISTAGDSCSTVIARLVKSVANPQEPADFIHPGAASLSSQ
jgi:hypothetical protein